MFILAARAGRWLESRTLGVRCQQARRSPCDDQHHNGNIRIMSKQSTAAIASAALALLFAGSAVAQDEPPATAPTPPAAEQPQDAGWRYWRLEGDGELVGRLVKEIGDLVYIDIGPRILELPASSVRLSESLEEARARGEEAAMAGGTGVFDITTERTGAEASRTQAEVVEAAKMSVVSILNPRGSAGSGFILNDEGYVVTNHHVIAGEKYHTVNVFVPDGEQWRREKFDNVEVESYSSYFDIALLKLDIDEVSDRGVDLVPLPVAPPRSVSVGDRVYAIGNPGLGRRLMEHTVSEGIVSSTARNFNDILYIQTTAAINPGNSGGPLINDRGQVIGLVTLGALFQEGLGFGLETELIHMFLKNSRSFAFSDQAQNEGFRYLSPE